MTDDPFAFLGEPVAPTDARAFIPDHVMDVLPPNTGEAEAASAFAYHLISEFQKPKTMPTVRKRLISANQFLNRLAEIAPETFDEVMCAYAERALIFDQPDAA